MDGDRKFNANYRHARANSTQIYKITSKFDDQKKTEAKINLPFFGTNHKLGGKFKIRV
jgi:hypothetical protein